MNEPRPRLPRFREEVGVERDVARLGQHGDDLGEHVLEHGADALRPEAVDRAVVEGLMPVSHMRFTFSRVAAAILRLE